MFPVASRLEWLQPVARLVEETVVVELERHPEARLRIGVDGDADVPDQLDVPLLQHGACRREVGHLVLQSNPVRTVSPVKEELVRDEHLGQDSTDVEQDGMPLVGRDVMHELRAPDRLEVVEARIEVPRRKVDVLHPDAVDPLSHGIDPPDRAPKGWHDVDIMVLRRYLRLLYRSVDWLLEVAPESPSPRERQHSVIIDADSRVCEPPDTWTSRMPSKWGELIPWVKRVDSIGADAWCIGDHVVNTLAFTVFYQSPDDPAPHRRKDDFPAQPAFVEEVHPSSWDPSERVKVLDDFGINMAALYPNLGLTNPDRYRTIPGATIDFQFDVIAAFNDFVLSWAQAEPGRFLPLAVVPYLGRGAVRIGDRALRGVGPQGLRDVRHPPFP